MIKKLISLLIILGWSAWIYGHNLNPLKIQYIAVEEGLSHCFFNSIFQESAVSLWINSNEGLTRFIKSDETSQNISRITLLHATLHRWKFLILIGIIIFVGLLIYFIRLSHKQHLEKKRIAEWAENSIEDERSLLRILIDSIPDTIYVKDCNSKFILANKRLSEIVHINPPNALIGKSDFDYFPSEMATQFYNDEQEIIRTGKPLIGKSEKVMDEYGKIRTFSTTKMPLRNKKGEIIGILGIGRDITQLTIIENELRENSDILQETNTLIEERQEKIEQQAETLRVQADTLMKMNTELEKSNQTKDKFFSIIAHDLKNPFSSILGFIDLLDINYDKWTDEKKHKIIKILKKTSESIYSLLENLLQWSRTQRGVIDFNPEELDLVELTNKSLEFINSQSSLKNITVNHNFSSDLIRIVADRKMIETVIRNLLSNAIKFTKQGGNIFVDVHEMHEGVQVLVRDTGVGMDEKTKSRLFKMEKNVSSAGTDNELGTGLGLLLCHEFIKMHKGSITVESEPDAGSTFTVYIPVSNK
jgi:two-component system, sensor histidine kinase and response regulator